MHRWAGFNRGISSHIHTDQMVHNFVHMFIRRVHYSGEVVGRSEGYLLASCRAERRAHRWCHWTGTTISDTSGAERLEKLDAQRTSSLLSAPESAWPWTELLGKRSVLTAVGSWLWPPRQISSSSCIHFTLWKNNGIQEIASSFIPALYLTVQAVPCLCQ